MGREISERAKDIIRQKRLHRVYPAKDTKIEIKVQEGLRNCGIEFEKHKAIIGQPDIFIEPNICILIDGCYWHGCEKCFDRNKMENKILAIKTRDNLVTGKLRQDGYIVLRFWEHDIKENFEDRVMDEIFFVTASSL